MEETIDQLTVKRNNITDSFELECRLTALECPFNWSKLHDLVKIILDQKPFIADLKTKLKENEESAPLYDCDEDNWYKFTILLLLAYIQQMECDSTGALRTIKEMEDIINKLDDGNTNPSFLDEIKPALDHITLATKAHLVEKRKVSSLINSIRPVTYMSNKERAGIAAVKSEIFLLLGHEGQLLALTYAEEAIQLNNTESQWWFLAGIAKGRIRRQRGKWSSNLTDKKELEYLHRAIDLESRPSYSLILAQAYRECAYNAFHASRNGEIEINAFLRTSINNMNEKSFHLYKSVMDCSNNPRTMIRCAQGLLKLPSPYKDLKAAKNLIDKCLKLSPENPYVHHVAAMFYEHPFQNYNKALEHLEIASDLGNYDATMHKIALHSQMDATYDQYDDLISAQERFIEEPLKLRTAKELGAYYLFKKHDIISALNYFAVIVKKDKGSLLENVFLNIYHTSKPINLLKIVVDETRLSLEKCNSQEKMEMQNFLDDVKRHFPRLLLRPPTSGQIADVIKISEHHKRNYWFAS